MSSDDGFVINKKTFEVFYYGSGEVMDKIGQGKDLAEAVEIAEKYEKEIGNGFGYGTEYGIRFVN